MSVQNEINMMWSVYQMYKIENNKSANGMQIRWLENTSLWIFVLRLIIALPSES